MSAGRIIGRDPATGAALAVTVANGVIAAIGPTEAPDAPYISAGLIDLQVNGFRGLDLNDGALTPERVSELARLMLSLGVTTWLPTLITASKASYLAALAAIATARRDDPLVARTVPFVHVEGPFLSPGDGPRGAHPREHIRPPDIAEVDAWQQAAGGLVGKVTISPHWPGSAGFVRALVGRGIIVAIGHTDATAEQIHDAAEAGASLSTHLGNGAAATLPRHPNFIWAQLADDRLTACFIADGFHLPADALRAMIRAKGLERSILVSDVAALGGMPPGIYGQAIGGQVDVGADGCLRVAGTPYLAGAGRPLCEDVARAIDMAGLTLAEALRLASANPGRLVGGRGRLEVGSPADLILFDWAPGATTLHLRQIYSAGEAWSAA